MGIPGALQWRQHAAIAAACAFALIILEAVACQACLQGLPQPRVWRAWRLRGFSVEAIIVDTLAGKSIGRKTRAQLRQADLFVALGTRTYAEKTTCKVSTRYEVTWWQESLGVFSGVGDLGDDPLMVNVAITNWSCT